MAVIETGVVALVLDLVVEVFRWFRKRKRKEVKREETAEHESR